LSGLERLISAAELSEYLDVPIETLSNWQQSCPHPAPVASLGDHGSQVTAPIGFLSRLR
jgi:hypothetical protein